MLIVPFASTAMKMLSGLTSRGSINSERWTSAGTVSIMRSNSRPHSLMKNSLEEASVFTVAFPSEVNTRKSERVVSFGPKDNASWVLPSRN
jgi:hypothetical protein